MSSIKVKGGSLKGVEIDPNNPDALMGADEVIAAAAAVLKDAMAGLATYNIVIAHEVASLGVPVFTEEIDTMAVTIGGDGIVRWLVNAAFLVEFGDVNTMFGIAHEVDHVILAHLVPDASLGFDEIGTLAKEIVINHRVMKLLGRDGVPSKDGQALIVDPKREYARYKKEKTKKGETPVSYEDFVDNDLACASYLREITPPKPQKQNICIRSNGEPFPGQDPSGSGQGKGDDDGDGKCAGHGHGNANAGIDPETAGKIVDGVLDQVMTRALKGDEAAKDALLDLGKSLGEDHPIWGNLGLGALRGETPPPVEVSFWEQYLLGALTSILVPGCRLVYPKKLIAFEEMYEEFGFRLPFMPLGEERQTRLLLAIDTSGSMPAEVLNRLAVLVGKIPSCETDWVCFDADVYPFEPGHSLRGGGGTSFGVVSDHVDNNDDDPYDCILMVTDGFAPHIMPAEPDKWVWLITPNGDMWAADKGMSCVIVDIPS